MIGEDGTEFLLSIDAMDKPAARKIIEDCYPEARIRDIESDDEIEARRQARWEALLARDRDDAEED
jgi:hypothetical protein